MAKKPSASVDSSAKVLTLQELSARLRELRAAGKRIVLCHGVFDLLHPGHIRHLEAARRLGDVLVVTITQDAHVRKGPGRPVFGQAVRAGSVAALACVDHVAINDYPTAVETLRVLRPHLYVKGQDYRDARKDVTGGIRLEEEAARAVGAKLAFTDEPMMSSSHLLNQHFQVYPAQARGFLQDFRQRWPAERVIRRLEGLRSVKTLVIGEAIIDEYHYCQAMGKSPKETIVSTRFIEAESFAGGALAAANHAAGFASKVRLVSVLGSKHGYQPFIRASLKRNVSPRFFERPGSSTIVKRRFVDPAFLTKMFEVSFLDDSALPAGVEGRLLAHLEAELPKHDLVLVTDYGHGMIGPKVVDLLRRKARFLAVNTQTNSANIGYNVITKYPRADYVCIDEPELRLAERDKHGPVEPLVLSVVKKLKARTMVVTRGHRGSMVYRRGQGFFSIPVFSEKVVDRTGAGDAYLALSALCAAAGLDMDLAGFVGNAAGALHVATVCNRTPIEPVALYKFVTALLK